MSVGWNTFPEAALYIFFSAHRRLSISHSSLYLCLKCDRMNKVDSIGRNTRSRFPVLTGWIIQLMTVCHSTFVDTTCRQRGDAIVVHRWDWDRSMIHIHRLRDVTYWAFRVMYNPTVLDGSRTPMFLLMTSRHYLSGSVYCSFRSHSCPEMTVSYSSKQQFVRGVIPLWQVTPPLLSTQWTAITSFLCKRNAFSRFVGQKANNYHPNVLSFCTIYAYIYLVYWGCKVRLLSWVRWDW